MPYLQNTSYKPPAYLFNRHLETIYPSLFRNPEMPNFKRERLELEDGDFLDLDWLKAGNKRLIILNHGLEGNSTKPYILGMSNIFSKNNFDVLAWNFRSCSGEMNRLPRFYHSGETGDMSRVISHASKDYESIVLLGFSLGGNVILKYLGESPEKVDKKVKLAITFSVPIFLEGSCYAIMKKSNFLYEKRFMNNLLKKVEEKSKAFPEVFNFIEISKVKRIIEFDGLVTAPLHGFEDAIDYYTQNSALQFLNNIKIPTLLVSAKNDPMLSEECFPRFLADDHDNFFFEEWQRGGHVGFASGMEIFNSEMRALEFMNDYLRD